MRKLLIVLGLLLVGCSTGDWEVSGGEELLGWSEYAVENHAEPVEPVDGYPLIDAYVFSFCTEDDPRYGIYIENAPAIVGEMTLVRLDNDAAFPLEVDGLFGLYFSDEKADVLREARTLAMTVETVVGLVYFRFDLRGRERAEERCRRLSNA